MTQQHTVKSMQAVSALSECTVSHVLWLLSLSISVPALEELVEASTHWCLGPCKSGIYYSPLAESKFYM